MNSIIDFIKTNWIWLVVIILITIITIIGFLADKKKSSKKEEKENETNPNDLGMEEQKNINPTINEPINNGFGLNINSMDTTIRPISENNMSNNEQINNNINGITPLTPNINNQINNLGTDRVQVENVNPNVTQNNAYQKPITNFENNPNNQEMFGNQITAPQNQNNYTNVISPIQQQNNIQPTPPQMNNVGLPQNQMTNQYSNVNTPNPMNQSMTMVNNQYNGNPNFNQNNTTIPHPVNPIPTPQPVRPQPIMNGMNNNSQMMNPNFGGNMTNQQMNQNIPTDQLQQNRITNSNIPVNFVFGPQNNNQNM